MIGYPPPSTVAKWGTTMVRLNACLLLFACAPLAAKPSPTRPDPEAKRPIAARDTVFIEDMTWMEVRDALRAGKTTAIVATGGVEQNGPYLATGKHNVILRGTTEAVARKLGDALVAPIVLFVPEGGIEPKSGHMLYPGTISVSQDTFRRLLSEICASLRAHGFNRIVLIGDSGGNQSGMRTVANRLNETWSAAGVRVLYIKQYYDYSAVKKWLEKQGVKQTPEGYHDDFAMTAQMMAVDPDSVRMNERIAAGKFRINGIELAPVEKSRDWGRKIIDFRAEATVSAIRAALKK
jgi:creatinine amidohydrolase